MDTDVNKELMFAYFGRKTSPLQGERIRQWLREPANEEPYFEWLEEWEASHPQYIALSEQAGQRYTAYLSAHPRLATDSSNRPARLGQTNHFPKHWLLVAGVTVGLLGLLGVLFQNQIRYVTHETAFGESRTLHLPDGSRVTLGANSSLRLLRWGFGNQARNVLLTGEASFKVAHTPTHQRFVVQTNNNFDVVVLGTEFTVFARKRGSRVALDRGKVELRYQEQGKARQLLMKPGQLAALDQDNHVALKPIKHHPLPSIEAGKRFVFDETPLQEVAYMLEDSYGLQVDIKDRQLAERVLMGAFRAENVDQLLQSISELLDIDVVRQGNRVQLKSH